jgi:hypothetical protein
MHRAIWPHRTALPDYLEPYGQLVQDPVNAVIREDPDMVFTLGCVDSLISSNEPIDYAYGASILGYQNMYLVSAVSIYRRQSPYDVQAAGLDGLERRWRALMTGLGDAAVREWVSDELAASHQQASRPNRDRPLAPILEARLGQLAASYGLLD